MSVAPSSAPKASTSSSSSSKSSSKKSSSSSHKHPHSTHTRPSKVKVPRSTSTTTSHGSSPPSTAPHTIVKTPSTIRRVDTHVGRPATTSHTQSNVLDRQDKQESTSGVSPVTTSSVLSPQHTTAGKNIATSIPLHSIHPNANIPLPSVKDNHNSLTQIHSKNQQPIISRFRGVNISTDFLPKNKVGAQVGNTNALGHKGRTGNMNIGQLSPQSHLQSADPTNPFGPVRDASGHIINAPRGGQQMPSHMPNIVAKLTPEEHIQLQNAANLPDDNATKRSKVPDANNPNIIPGTGFTHDEARSILSALRPQSVAENQHFMTRVSAVNKLTDGALQAKLRAGGTLTPTEIQSGASTEIVGRNTPANVITKIRKRQPLTQAEAQTIPAPQVLTNAEIQTLHPDERKFVGPGNVPLPGSNSGFFGKGIVNRRISPKTGLDITPLNETNANDNATRAQGIPITKATGQQPGFTTVQHAPTPPGHQGPTIQPSGSAANNSPIDNFFGWLGKSVGSIGKSLGFGNSPTATEEPVLAGAAFSGSGNDAFSNIGQMIDNMFSKMEDAFGNIPGVDAQLQQAQSQVQNQLNLNGISFSGLGRSTKYKSFRGRIN